MAASTPTPSEGQVFEDYTRGSGLTWDSTSSTIATAPGITSVEGGAPGGVNAETDGNGNVTLSGFNVIANSLAELPTQNLPTDQAQCLFAWRRDLLQIWVYDPLVGQWAAAAAVAP